MSAVCRLRCLGLALAVVVGASADRAFAESDSDFFEKKIRPLLAERCGSCHSAAKGKTRGGLALDTREGWQQGGDSGAAIVPGKPEESLLIRAVRYRDDGPQMPPKEMGGKLAEAEINLLVDWVRRGAPDPRTTAARIGGATLDDARKWWAFQPVRPTTPPIVKESNWPRTDIDRFVLAELEQRGLTHADNADKRMLIRRATFDVTGLPPSPDEIEAFLRDESPGAFEAVVDRLLGSPAYGQRGARHWLDVVRYADFHDGDPKARNPVCEPLEAWRYRDWVVESFNRDLPFDQFLVHQIAGDLLPAPDGKEPNTDGLIATTFLVNGAWDRGDADKEKMVSDMVDDQIDTVGKAFLGLTLGCSRCHDHKFDPVTQSDYYALAGIFYSTRMLKELGTKGGEITLQRRPLVPREVVEKRDQQVKQIAEWNAKLAELDKQSPKPPADDPARLELVAQRDRLQKELPPEPPATLAVSEGGVPGGLFPGIQDVPIHIRGSYTRLGDVVPRRMPSFFAGDRQPPIASGSGRRELAEWVASKENPLTARVIVNRVWQWHFGAGLVRTPNNFGMLSEPPSHPALLDWLAAKFVEDGWSLKRLHRRIMLSATYQLSSKVDGRGLMVEGQKQHGEAAAPSSPSTLNTQPSTTLDPDNRWLGQFTARRLEAEAIRDAMLFVTGKLDPATGGPASDNLAIARRSLYVQTARWDRSNFATLFDAANPDASDEKRNVSTVAPQSLFLLNHPFALDQAQLLADRLIREVPGDTPNVEAARIQLAYHLLFSRPASDEELAIARQVMAQTAEPTAESGWTDLAHVLLCSNEFIYID
ncbi:MAG: PSD1 and planctomycete cytochrome C domain-containing protein [Planctomycetota bacterium]